MCARIGYPSVLIIAMWGNSYQSACVRENGWFDAVSGVQCAYAALLLVVFSPCICSCLGDPLHCLNLAVSLSKMKSAWTLQAYQGYLRTSKYLITSRQIVELFLATKRANMSIMAHERSLRVLTLLTTALVTPLLIATTIISVHEQRNNYYYNRKPPITAFSFGFIPLALTALASSVSLLYHRKHSRMPGPRSTILDCVAGLSYLGVLLPIWIVEVGRLVKPGYGLLTGYLTSPMIINM